VVGHPRRFAQGQPVHGGKARGTRHIDHDHLVLAIRGVLEDGTTPQAGATPRFDLHIATALANASDGAVSQTVIRWSNACQ
jgi:hypothetical protein